MLKIVALTAVFLLSASAVLGQQRAELVVFDRGHSLSFAHLCSELGHGYDAYWQAYAFFEQPATDDRYRALVLAKVRVGWVAGAQALNGVALDIEKKRFALPPEWYGDPFGLALQLVAVQTQQTITGPIATSHLYSTGNYPEDKEYQLSATGELDWVQFVEPEERDAKADNTYNHSPELHVYSENIPALEESYRLNMVVENTRTSARLTLEGPVLKNLPALLQIEKPQYGVLGLAQVMNPFQQGGVWDWLRTGWRYRNCIQRRKQAKQELDRRFTRRPFIPSSPH